MLDLATLDNAGTEGLPRRIPAWMKKDLRQSGIAEAAEQRLQGSAYHGVHHVQCYFQDGMLILRGRVASYHHKQMAQEAIRNLHGVNEILNRVEVRPVQKVD